MAADIAGMLRQLHAADRKRAPLDVLSALLPPQRLLHRSSLTRELLLLELFQTVDGFKRDRDIWAEIGPGVISYIREVVGGLFRQREHVWACVLAVNVLPEDDATLVVHQALAAHPGDADPHRMAILAVLGGERGTQLVIGGARLPVVVASDDFGAQ